MAFCGISPSFSPPYTNTVGLQTIFAADFFAPLTASTKRPGATSNRYEAFFRASDGLPAPPEGISTPSLARLRHS
ncbi:uncharacterized protein TRIVIDRAFT_214252 [Trichoderma virens Gv29-8]|uniref:Uncharacterized protein n=1 Tax=Hypocrea virens (strain Gv29-8 / FGSC 10586) TaxID=413071 RepID=G9N7P8_HYPVG|nr:uncharacterized protein TRIVIDRAFT_214252 [Trichoderma virens Gv29-8]EHK17013.1 hypothetical protein TRIVIDRAFT_214252 [Trichoderma virens Gv29-8]